MFDDREITSENPNGYYEWSLPSNTLHCSPQWCAVIGATGEELTGHPQDWLDRIHPADYQKVIFALRPLVLGEADTFDQPHRLKCSDGSYLLVTCRGALLRTHHQDPYCIMGVISPADPEISTPAESRSLSNESNS